MLLRSNISFSEKCCGLLKNIVIQNADMQLQGNVSFKSFGFDIKDCWTKLQLHIAGSYPSAPAKSLILPLSLKEGEKGASQHNRDRKHKQSLSL